MNRTLTPLQATSSTILLDREDGVAVAQNLPPLIKQQVVQAKSSIDFQKDTFGLEVQNKISDFGKAYLQDVKLSHTGEVQGTLLDVKQRIKTVGDVIPSGAPNIFQRLFRVGTNQLSRFVDKQRSVDSFLSQVETTIRNQAKALSDGVIQLEHLYMQTKLNYEELCIFIAAGIERVEEERQGPLEQLRLRAEETKSIEDIQAYNEHRQKIETFEQRLHNLKISRMICLQQGPQIRATQSNHRKTIENLQQVVTQLLPSWRSNIILLIQQYEGKKALEMEKSIRDATDQLLLQNSERLKTNTIEAARLATTNHVKIETIKTIQTNLFTMIDETVKIQEEAVVRRKQESQELIQLEEQLKNKLLRTSSR